MSSIDKARLEYKVFFLQSFLNSHHAHSSLQEIAEASTLLSNVKFDLSAINAKLREKEFESFVWYLKLKPDGVELTETFERYDIPVRVLCVGGVLNNDKSNIFVECFYASESIYCKLVNQDIFEVCNDSNGLLKTILYPVNRMEEEKALTTLFVPWVLRGMQATLYEMEV